MAKWFGKVGYDETGVDAFDKWTSHITERSYYGDTIKLISKWETRSENTNDDLKLNISISIIADQFAYQSFHLIKYVEYMGTKWKVIAVEPQPPRLVLTLGGVWNERDE